MMVDEIAAGSARPARLRRMTRSNAPRQSVGTAPVTVAAVSSTGLESAQPAVDEQAAALGVQQGVAAFVAPPPMEVGKFSVIKFVAGPNQQAITTETEGVALTRSTAVYVAKAMKVTLLPNPSFEIKPATEARQTTGLDKTATWLWNVKPLDDRNQTLEAEIEIFALNDDDSFGRRLERYTRKVEVEVRVGKMQRFSEAVDDGTTIAEKLSKLFGSWQKAVGALVALLGAIGVLAWRLGLRKLKPAE